MHSRSIYVQHFQRGRCSCTELWFPCFFRVKEMYFHVNGESNLKAPLYADDVYEVIMKVWKLYNSVTLCKRAELRFNC
jgi:hypothetical protein